MKQKGRKAGFALRFFWALSGVLFALTGYVANAQSPVAAQQKSVFVLYDEHDKLPGLAALDQSLRSTLASATFAKIDVYNESMDHSRFDDAGYERFLLDYLRQKYSRKKIDVMVAVMGPSLDFLMKYGADISPGTPIVFCGVDQRELEGRHLSPNVTGVMVKRDFNATLDIALKLQPNTRKVVFVSGSSSFDKRLAVEAGDDLRPYESRLEIEYLTDFDVNDMLNKVSQLPPNTIILCSTVFRDGTGTSFVPHDVISMISQRANAPVYGFVDQYLGRGIVGGHLYSLVEHGKTAAEMSLRLLEGQAVADLPIVEGDLSTDMFDWRALQKWDLDERKLPVGSVVQYRTPSIWEQYRAYMAVIGAILIFQSMLIASLLVTRARRRKAEADRNRFQSLAAAEHARLDEVVSNVPGVVWESRVTSGPDNRRIEFVSDYAEKMLGYTPKEIEAVPNFWRSIVVDEDQPTLDQNLQEIFAGRNRGIQQFRCRTKDGKVIWVDAYLVATYDEAGNISGLRGVAIDVTDRKIAEDELRDRELDLSEAQRLARLGSWEWDPATGTVIWSEELYRIAGLDPSSPAPSFEEQKKIYTKESYDRLASTVEKALETGTSFELEMEMIRSDQQRIWVSGRGEVIRDEIGRIVRVRGTLQDINDRKRADQELSESEARYRDVVENQSEMICRYLPDTTLTFVNDAYCRYFQKTREELIGTKFIDLIPAHARAASLEHIASLIEDPRIETYEHEVIRPDGSAGWHQWTDRSVETFNNEPAELQGIGRDISDKHRVEEALRASESRFRTMADSAPVLIWMCGPDKLCSYVNKGWLDFTGRTLEMELGTGWANIHPDDKDRAFGIMDTAFERREPFRFEYRLRAADGNFYWVYNSGTPRFSAEGEFLGYIGSCVDISDRKAAEEEIKRGHEEVLRLQKQLQEENIYLKEVIKLEHSFDEIIGQSDSLKYVLYKIEQVAPTDATVLICGETGTGKELVARAVHRGSPRKSRPLVTVNCASLSAGLIESELFGHERGAFTGATARKIGRFELADGASLFLDEIGELPLELQAKLLRVLEEGEFERLGSSKTIKVDVRIIAATNRRLEAEVEKGSFRKDLLFRLNIFPITVPPLRERKDDIPLLVEHFTSRFAKKIGKNIRSISPATVRRLSEHYWPGNIRELANVIERSVINTQTDSLLVLDSFAPSATANNAPTVTLEAVERKHITQVLEQTRWKIEGPDGAAQILDMNPSTLRTRMSKLGIVKHQKSGNLSEKA